MRRINVPLYPDEISPLSPVPDTRCKYVQPLKGRLCYRSIMKLCYLFQHENNHQKPYEYRTKYNCHMLCVDDIKIDRKHCYHPSHDYCGENHYYYYHNKRFYFQNSYIDN